MASGSSSPHLHYVKHQIPLILFPFSSVCRKKSLPRRYSQRLSPKYFLALLSTFWLQKRLFASSKSIICLLQASLWLHLVLDVFHHKPKPCRLFSWSCNEIPSEIFNSRNSFCYTTSPLKKKKTSKSQTSCHLHLKLSEGKWTHLPHICFCYSFCHLSTNSLQFVPQKRNVLNIPPAPHVFHACLEGILMLLWTLSVAFYRLETLLCVLLCFHLWPVSERPSWLGPSLPTPSFWKRACAISTSNPSSRASWILI